MVAGGFDDDVTSHKDTQIIDLSKQKQCKWNDFPLDLGGATGAIMPNDDTIICGGMSNSGIRH